MANAGTNPEIDAPSPCISLCTLDAAGEVCVGCYRTLDEISDWAGMSVAQRHSVLQAVEQRRLAAELQR